MEKLKVYSARSRRDVNQFCFGSVLTEPRPGFGKLDPRDQNSWTKEGLSVAWRSDIHLSIYNTLGFTFLFVFNLRKLKKSCCSVCCMDNSCPGCRSCLCR